jgi:hypothetical protein
MKNELYMVNTPNSLTKEPVSKMRCKSAHRLYLIDCYEVSSLHLQEPVLVRQEGEVYVCKKSLLDPSDNRNFLK